MCPKIIALNYVWVDELASYPKIIVSVLFTHRQVYFTQRTSKNYPTDTLNGHFMPIRRVTFTHESVKYTLATGSFEMGIELPEHKEIYPTSGKIYLSSGRLVHLWPEVR